MENTKTFTFDGVLSSSFGVYIAGDGVYNAPARVYEMVDIPGRNGQLAIDHKRFENIEVKYPAFYYSSDHASFAADMQNLRAALCSRVGYKELSDTYNPNEYRLAVYKDGLEVDPAHYNTAGEFEIVFDCKPQRFLASGIAEQSVSSGGSINNPTEFEALPLIRATGAGTVTINGVSFTLSGSTTKYIDCDIMECYTAPGPGTIAPANNLITVSEFPKLQPGYNIITYTGVTNVFIKPRWWTI